MPLLETIEQKAAARGVPVDARIERGRTLRHGVREAIAHERFDRIVVAAAGVPGEGFGGDDIAWLLDHAPGEVVIIRPAGDDRLNGEAGSRHTDCARLPPSVVTRLSGATSSSSTAGIASAAARPIASATRPITGGLLNSPT